MTEHEDRPVLTGLAALVAVAIVVGLVLGVTALVGTSMLGLRAGDSSSEANTGGGATLYLPTPSKSDGPDGPLVTLASTPTPTQSATAEESPTMEPTKKAKKEITLTAGQTAVGSFDRIDLTGTYALGEGAILQVQRLEDGSWELFNVTMSVNNGAFSTYVQTSRPGINEFRVVDLDTGLASNKVKVRVG